MKHDLLFPKIKEYQPDMLQLLEQLVNHESPSDDKPALDSYARMLSDRFEDLGAETTIITVPTSGNHLQVNFPAVEGGSDRPGLLAPRAIGGTP